MKGRRVICEYELQKLDAIGTVVLLLITAASYGKLSIRPFFSFCFWWYCWHMLLYLCDKGVQGSPKSKPPPNNQ